MDLLYNYTGHEKLFLYNRIIYWIWRLDRNEMEKYSEPRVGARLRALREEQKLSLRALASRCGLSVNAISQIERGENSPTVSSLHRLSMALNVPITEFFEDTGEQPIIHIRSGRGLRTENRGVAIESLGIGLQNQQLGPFRMEVQPGMGNMDDPVSHPGEEFLYCLFGKIECKIGDRLFHLGSGDSLLFDSSQPHSYRNPAQVPAAMLMIYKSSPDQPHIQRLHLDE